MKKVEIIPNNLKRSITNSPEKIENRGKEIRIKDEIFLMEP